MPDRLAQTPLGAGKNYTTHQFLEVGSEHKVQDEPCIIEGPELLDDSRPHVVVVYRGEEVAQETTHVVVELGTRTDGVALTLHRHGHGASLKEKISEELHEWLTKKFPTSNHMHECM